MCIIQSSLRIDRSLDLKKIFVHRLGHSFFSSMGQPLVALPIKQTEIKLECFNFGFGNEFERV
jgi:hypothetical protein